MKTVLFIGYYEMKEHIMYLAVLFEKYGYQVLNYPLFQYAYDNNDKLPDYKDHLHNFIHKHSPDIIFWLFLDVPSDIFKYIKKLHPNIYYIMYNIDDPSNINTETLERAKIFDIILTPCKENMKQYIISSGVTNIIWAIPGYNPNYFYPLDTNIENIDSGDLKYVCDISIYCFNLLDSSYYSNQYINRKMLIDNVIEYCSTNNKVFKIFGPPTLKVVYPQHYNGDIEYINLNKLYNYSKINICTHIYSNKELSISESEIKILGSGSLLFMDKIKGYEKMFSDGENCIIIDKDNYLEQIDKILKSYDDYKGVKDNGYILSKNYTWDKFIERVHIEICNHFFAPSIFKELYQEDITELKDVSDNDAIWEIWLSKGIKNNLICTDFHVPDNFDHLTYAAVNNIDNRSIKKVYLHWYLNGKLPEYINKTNSIVQTNIHILNTQQFNIDPESLIDIFAIFNKIKDGDNQLEELCIKCKQIPRIKINNCLEEYFNFCDQ